MRNTGVAPESAKNTARRLLGLCASICGKTLLAPISSGGSDRDCYNHHEITYFHYIIDSLPSRVGGVVSLPDRGFIYEETPWAPLWLFYPKTRPPPAAGIFNSNGVECWSGLHVDQLTPELTQRRLCEYARSEGYLRGWNDSVYEQLGENRQSPFHPALLSRGATAGVAKQETTRWAGLSKARQRITSVMMM